MNAILDDTIRLATVELIPSFPCLADKRPACPHGFKAATKDPEKLKQLWRQFPGELVGVPTGEASGLFVVDVDSPRHLEAAEWFQRQTQCLPETRVHQTRSGGLHLIFRHRSGLKNSAGRLARGVDTRGEGGFIIWWPFHLRDADHRLLSIAEIPAWIIQALGAEPAKVIPFPAARKSFSNSIGGAMSRVEGIVATVARAREGERNAITYWGACRIRDMLIERELDHATGCQAISAVAEAASRTGLSANEIRRTIMSATGVAP